MWTTNYSSFLMITVALIALQSTYASAKDTLGCKLENRVVKLVYEGWPTKMSCRPLISAMMRSAFPRKATMKNATCVVIDGTSNATLWSEPIDSTYGFSYHSPDYYTPNISRNSTKIYHVNLRTLNNTCNYDEIILNVSRMPKQICKRDQKKYPIISSTGRQGQLKSMECSVPFDEEPKIDLIDGEHNYAVTWYRNCTEINPKKYPEVYLKTERNLVIKSLDFSISGIYSCALTYNGQTRYPVQFGVCVKPPEYYSKPTIRCPNSVTANLGESVKFSCNVSLGFRTVQPFSIHGQWQQVDRNNTYSCENPGRMIGIGWNERGECYSNMSQEHNEKCYLYEPTDHEKTPMKNILVMNLEIRNAKMSDFGKYVAIYKDLRGGKVNDTTHLIYDFAHQSESYYMYIIIVLSVVVGVLVIGLLAVVLRNMISRSSKSF